MKKLFMFLLSACICVAAGAQSIGIVGGVTGTDMKINSADIQSLSQYHVGIAYNRPLILGLAIQPELLYNVKGVTVSELAKVEGLADVKDKIDARCGYAEFGFQLQAGINAGVARAYVFGEPFVGYAITSDITSALSASISENQLPTISGSLEGFDYVNRLEYGLAMGAGLQVFKHIQASARYFWNFGPLYNGQDLDIKDVANIAADTFVNAFKNQESFAGFSLSLTLFF